MYFYKTSLLYSLTQLASVTRLLGLGRSAAPGFASVTRLRGLPSAGAPGGCLGAKPPPTRRAATVDCARRRGD